MNVENTKTVHRCLEKNYIPEIMPPRCDVHSSVVVAKFSKQQQWKTTS